MASPRRPKLSRVSVSLPFGLGSAEWVPDESQRRAAWELYVELTTRVAVQSLELDHGLLREALSSLHALFGVTREILRGAGPSVGASRKSVGGIAMAVLNRGIRPFLAKWHPELLNWESKRERTVSPSEHERAWITGTALREELGELREALSKYADMLALVAGVTD